MKKNALFFWLAFLFAASLQAQDGPLSPASRHSLSLGLGLSQVSVRDQNASPLLYQNNLPQVTLRYQHSFKRGELQVGLQARYGNYTPKAYRGRAVNLGEVVVPLTSKLAAGHFSLNYLHRVNAAAKSAWYLGTGLQQLLQYPTEAPYAGLVSVTALPLILKVQHQFNAKNLLESQVQYTLAGLLSRFPWHATLSLPDVTSNLKALYQNNTRVVAGYQLNQVAWQTQFQHQVSPHLRVGLSYQFERLVDAKPRRLHTWSNSLSAQSAFTF
ncbi:hypothetical protein HUW51_14775 [Adhaeribacter swui]|uniref:Outer membrane beta-barrel protein n=1 Tax=Adhaeribacter swui TaxID=2086471 RepID=A0A7G7G9U1_9BACT|nr:hypothetical protein [Adhaeribacter swui]QNF33925.1 hypothetical protein HUW51_14775 [Adhaeribacter swui]